MQLYIYIYIYIYIYKRKLIIKEKGARVGKWCSYAHAHTQHTGPTFAQNNGSRSQSINVNST